MAEVLHPGRRALIALGAGAAILPAIACSKVAATLKGGEPKAVVATEDLMREHGVLRRALRIYDQIAARMTAGKAPPDPKALAGVAQLFRDFGEDYHERMLEEAFVFPRVKQAGGRAAALADVLRDQHERGRDITDYVLGLARRGAIGAGDAGPLAQALAAMVSMYENHAAREDTIVFPAWKAALSDSEFKDVGAQYEDIEKKVFGTDGFDEAEKTVSRIEQQLGFADLAAFTAPAPPTPSPGAG